MLGGLILQTMAVEMNVEIKAFNQSGSFFYFFYYKDTIEYTKDQYGIKTTCKMNRIVCVVP